MKYAVLWNSMVRAGKRNRAKGCAIAAGRFALLQLLILCGAESHGALTKLWEQSYDGPPTGSTQDEALEVIRLGSGDFIVAGTSADFGRSGADLLVIRYSGTDGSTIWNRRYNSPDSLNDKLIGAAVDFQGNVYVLGEVNRLSSRRDFYTAKYAGADGALLWERSYDGPQNLDDHPASIAVDATGNVFVAGHSENGENDDIYLAKYATADGALLWERRYGSPENDNDYARALAVDTAGDVIITGSSAFRFYTVKYAGGNGNIVWERRDGGPGIGLLEGNRVALDSQGNVFVSGRSFGEGTYNIYVAKFAAADGAMSWDRIVDSHYPLGDEARALAVDSSGNLLIGGIAGTNLYIAEYAGGDGAIVWERQLPGQRAGASIVHDAVVNATGDLFIAGFLEETNYLARLSGVDGSTVWETIPNGVGRTIALDGDQNIVFTGFTLPGSSRADFYTAKHSAADGTLQWEESYNEIASSADYGLLSTMDGDGNVFVHGNSDTNQYLAKYSSTNGQVLWQILDERYVLAMAADLDGNLALTGRASEGTNDVMFVTKRTADGNLAWEKFVDPPTNGLIRGWAVAADTNGNIIASGTYPREGSLDIYTAKYRGGDGDLVWERFHASPGRDWIFRVVLDARQDVFLAGYLDEEFFVTKYSGVDGSILWEQQRPITNNWIGVSHHAVVDRNGDILATGGSRTLLHVAKFRGVNGAPVWEKNIFSGPGREVGAHAIALDSAGNLVIGGYYTENHSGARAGALFVKYGAESGAVLWENRALGPRYVRLAGMAIDQADDVVAGILSGIDDEPGTPTALSVVKLAGNNGQMLTQVAEPAFLGFHGTATPDGTLAITGARLGDLTTMLYRVEPRVVLNAIREASGLRLHWPFDHTGFRLQSRSGSNGLNPAGAWNPLPNSAVTNSVIIPIDLETRSAFFQLVQP